MCLVFGKVKCVHIRIIPFQIDLVRESRFVKTVAGLPFGRLVGSKVGGAYSMRLCRGHMMGAEKVAIAYGQFYSNGIFSVLQSVSDVITHDTPVEYFTPFAVYYRACAYGIRITKLYVAGSFCILYEYVFFEDDVSGKEGMSLRCDISARELIWTVTETEVLTCRKAAVAAAYEGGVKEYAEVTCQIHIAELGIHSKTTVGFTAEVSNYDLVYTVLYGVAYGVYGECVIKPPLAVIYRGFRAVDEERPCCRAFYDLQSPGGDLRSRKSIRRDILENYA